MAVDKVLLASPRGFCAGVEMAIKALAWMVRSFDEPVYCYHEIVHNKIVVDRFIEKGVVFVDSIDDVPEGSPIMLSAHGSAPEVVAAARSRGSYVVDAVCPLVTKVHHEVKTRAGKGFHMLAQTTLSHREWNEVAVQVKSRFPNVWTPGRSDLCFATTNRQSALTSIAPRVDAFIVIGSSNSSNTRALERLAMESGCQQVYRVNSADELPDTLFGTVGVTAGASAPEELVLGVLNRLAPVNGVEEVFVTDEDEYFPPPRNIRDLQAAIDLAITAMSGAAVLATPAMDDRALAASTVLEALSEA